MIVFNFGRYGPVKRAQVIYEAAKLLRMMHDAGYVHRDIKPGNIVWLPSHGAWTLIDFGCAARTGASQPAVSNHSDCIKSSTNCPLQLYDAYFCAKSQGSRIEKQAPR